MNNKPVTIAIHEFKQKLDYAIFSSGLPAVVLEPIVTAYANALARAAAEQTQKDFAEWNSEISEEKDSEKGE